MNLKEAMTGKISEEEIEKLPRAYEVLGEIAVLELPKELQRHKKLIAETLVKLNKGIKTVLLKIGDVAGEYRVAKYELLIGESTATIHMESGCRFRLDLSKVYYNSKLSGERLKVAAQVKDGEEILVMFAGVGPYPIVISKRRDVKVWAIEINPAACKFMAENILLNNVYGRVFAICGDVRKEVPRLTKAKKFDRIIMPAPKSAGEFLDLALGRIKKGGIINYYDFAREDEMQQLPNKIEAACQKFGKKIKILETRLAGATAPRTWRVAIDFKVV